MKKRSLVSAIAMLVVSAIVLTSATFAWFSSASTASITTMTSKVSNANGSISISADNSNFKNELTRTDFSAVSANKLCAEEGSLAPISLNGANWQVVGGAINGGKFTGAAAADGTYYKFTVYVKSAAQGKVDVAFTGTGSTPGFIFYGMHETTAGATKNEVITNASGTDSYLPVTNNNGAADDSNGDDIISTTEAAAGSVVLGETVSTTSSGVLTLDFSSSAANAVKSIEVVVWAEGQEASCTGAVASTNVPFGLSFTLQGADAA